MFLSLWHYLQGYVIVEVSGFNVEKFLNMITYHGLFLWNIQRNGQKVRFSASIKDFKAMKQDVRKTRSRLKIVEKHGFPFFLYRYKKRKSFAIGIGIFIAMLWFLSSFVWLVEVEGNSRINSLDIIQTLEENGYNTGRWKGKMNLREAETVLLKQYPDIIWAGIDYEGTRMIVRVAESILPPTMNPLEIAPKSLISKRDALITYIAIEKGKPMVKAGDIVKKGDMLVAGEMPLGEENPSPYYTAAKGTIRGKTIYAVARDISLDQVRKNYTNETSKKYILKFFDKNFTFFSEKALTGQYDKMLTLHQLRITKLFPLPFGIEVQTCISYTPAYYTLTKEEAEDRLLSELWEEVSKSLSGEVKILKREAYFKQTEGHISGTLYVVAEEEISYPIEVEQEMQNKGEMLNE